MSTGSVVPPESSSSSGVQAVLRYTGIPRSWLKRPKLPSRNWLIFLSTTSTLIGLYVYDRHQCKLIKQSYVDRVKHLADEPLASWDSPRKVTVYGSKWPGDEDYTQSIKFFRKYVKPILVAAAIDYDVYNGKKHGDLVNYLADKIKSERRQALGIDPPPPPPPMPIPGDSSKEAMKRKELEGGVILIGRQTFKEYMEGLRRGWTESPLSVDREEALASELELDGRFDEPEEEFSTELVGEPIPTQSRLLPSTPMSKLSGLQLRTPVQAATHASQYQQSLPAAFENSPDRIPPYPPFLLVPFTDYIGFKQIPFMIFDFFYQRRKVSDGAKAALRLIEGHHRPITAPSEGLSNCDLDFDRQAEGYYSTSFKAVSDNIEKARSGYYKTLPDKLATARALVRGTREPTKDELANPPPTEVELRSERSQKELKWRGEIAGWEVINPEKEVTWDERFRDSLKVFVDSDQKQ